MKVEQNEVREFITNAVVARANILGLALENAEQDRINLFDSGVLDSYAFVELMGSLESRFNFTLELMDTAVSDLSTIGGLTKTVISQLNS